MMRKVWVDTDIGTDVDDLLALVYALKNSELEVVGISTVYGNAERRAKIAAKVSELAGRKVDIFAGTNKPLSGETTYLIGYEGEGIDYDESKISAKPAEQALESKLSDAQLSIACMAPMTNIALALTRNQKLSAQIHIMGNHGSHNFKVDTVAADVVMRYKNNVRLITTDVAKKVYLTTQELFALRTGNAFLDAAIQANASNWLLHSPYKDRIYLYDPLTVAAIARPDLLSFEHVGGARISVDVKATEFKEHFLEVLVS